MRAILDGDILRYEVGYAAEVGWRAKTGDETATPPFDYCRDLLNQRIGYIRGATRSDRSTIYMTEGETFRYKIAKKKPYKGTRKGAKPWHFDNLTVYMRDVLGAKVVTEIEADDAMAIDHINSADETVLCSRDKDLKQVPGLFFSWELGAQPSFGPTDISPVGSLSLNTEKKQPKLTGTGYAFFAAQVLMGDSVDNIPGLPKCGPVAAYEALCPCLEQDVCPTIEDALKSMEMILVEEYDLVYGEDWEKELTEQASLCWVVRRPNPDGTPETWRKGLFV